ncbi:MAG: hypothetical protein IK085_02610 [Clostridia bacterium]|nr:hypothetical protein [Clostridia bacterium]
MSYYRNPEGYSDPTAGAAFEHIARQERAKRRKEQRKKNRKKKVAENDR